MLDRISMQMREANQLLLNESHAEHYYDSAPLPQDSLKMFSIEQLDAMRANSQVRSRQSALLEALSKESNLKPLRLVNESIMQSINVLKSKFSNFYEVIDAIYKELLLASIMKPCPVRLIPILLVGPPGVGKTYFLNSLAKAFDVPFSQVDMASVSAGFVLAGNSSSWAEGKPGHVSDALRASHVANPIILLDELDKASGSRYHDATGSLYTLLERDTARTFKDECLGIAMDCSAIIWFASANYVEQVPTPIQSRMRIMHVESPTSDMMPAICRSVFEDLLTASSWGQCFDQDLDDEIAINLSSLSPRKIKFTLYNACCNAVIRTGGASEIRLVLDDINIDEHVPRDRRIGFI